MLTGIRHNTAALGFVLFAVVLSACGGTQQSAPSPVLDLEATVQSRLAEERAIEASVEAKAIVEATVQVPPTAISILSNAKRAMAGLGSYHYNGNISVKDADRVIPIEFAGDLQAPNRLRETTSTNLGMSGPEFETAYIRIGGQSYKKEPMAEWAATDEYEGFRVNEWWSFLFDFPIAAEPALEEIDGISVYHMKWDLQEGSKDSAFILNFFGDSDEEDLPEIFKIEFWVDVESYYLKKFVTSSDMPSGFDAHFSLRDELEAKGYSPEVIDSLSLSPTGAESSDTGSFTMTVTLSAFDEDLPLIVAPMVIAQPALAEVVPEVKSDLALNSGLDHFSLGEYQQAIEDYDEAIRLDSQHPTGYSNRGFAYHLRGEYQRAIEDYDEAIRLDPQNVVHYYSRGAAYGELDRYKLARDDYDEAIRLDPQEAIIYYSRGLIFMELGQPERAIEDYDEAIRLDPQHIEGYTNRGLAYHILGQYQQAIEDYEEAIRREPSAEIYYMRGLANQALGENHAAGRDFEKAEDLGYTP